MKLTKERIEEIDKIVQDFSNSDMTSEEFHKLVSIKEYIDFQVYHKRRVKKLN